VIEARLLFISICFCRQQERELAQSYQEDAPGTARNAIQELPTPEQFNGALLGSIRSLAHFKSMTQGRLGW
jgi:hypothetical protein